MYKDVKRNGSEISDSVPWMNGKKKLARQCGAEEEEGETEEEYKAEEPKEEMETQKDQEGVVRRVRTNVGFSTRDSCMNDRSCACITRVKERDGELELNENETKGSREPLGEVRLWNWGSEQLSGIKNEEVEDEEDRVKRKRKASILKALGKTRDER